MKQKSQRPIFLETQNKMDILDKFLEVLRSKRNFDAKTYIDKKTDAINSFFRENNLDSAVVGISGGIDSAVVYALLNEASKKENSPISKVLGLIMPIFGNGTTNQLLAKDKAKNFCERICERNHSMIFHICDLTKSYEAYLESSAWGFLKVPFSNGQVASIVRTPCLYHHAAQLQDAGYKSIVVGTTNRDEGSYIGFFGKASDAMVDLQPIADIHKSEVYKIAEILGVSREIIEAKPAGDVHDGRTDEEMIGAPYWFVELYLLMKQENTSLSLHGALPGERLRQIIPEIYDNVTFKNYSEKIEEIHNKNSHKYKVGSPARFIDVMERKIEGGWS